METPPFDDALPSFAEFLASQGFRTSPVWVFREDVISSSRSCWIRLPLPVDHQAFAREYFEWGRAQGRGVTLEALGRMNDQTVCFVWVPEDDESASYAMQGPLKFKVPVEPIETTGIRSRLRWRWLLWLHRHRRDDPYAFLLPRRAAVNRLIGRE